MLKAGLCGYGGLGHVHANNLAAMDDVDFCAVCDINPKQLEKSEIKINIETTQGGFDISKARTYLDFDEMLEKEQLDFIVTALPTDIHAEYAVKAMEHGCHVMSEKPMALTVAECDRMIEASRRTGKQLMVAQCIRFWPEYEYIEQCIKDCRYGTLRSLFMERIGSIHEDGSWFNDHKRSGGPTIDMHVHDCDWARNMVGKPDRVYAGGVKGIFDGIEDITTFWLYNDGPIVSFRSGWTNPGPFRMAFRICFEDATLTMPGNSGPGLWMTSLKDPVEKQIEVRQGSAYADELRYFVDCILGKHPNTRCTPESTRESIAMATLELELMEAGGGGREL